MAAWVSRVKDSNAGFRLPLKTQCIPLTVSLVTTVCLEHRQRQARSPAESDLNAYATYFRIAVTRVPDGA